MTPSDVIGEPPRPADLPRALALEAVHMSKAFGANKALDDVSLKVEAGELHALLGENGAGKSTLVKCVMGFYHADSGQLMIDGREQLVDGPRAAQALGIGMVYQHFTLVPGMTVLENFVLSRARLPAVLDWKAERAKLEAFLAKMPFKVPLDAYAADLAAGDKQKVEILRQLYLDNRFLILDEPTSVLTPGEATEVLGLLRAMTRAKSITVMMITHKMREVMAFADRVTVLRQGRLVGSADVATGSPEQFAAMMIGDGEVAPPASRAQRDAGAVRLKVDGLAVTNEAGKRMLRGATLDVRAGEIVGIAGVSGNGQRELVEILAGQRLADEGGIAIDGKAYGATRAEASALGVACLPEEPLRNACVGAMSVAENMAFRDFDRPPHAKGGWWLQPGSMRDRARGLISTFKVRTPGPDAPIGTLSGGNVQRAVLGRELGRAARVLVVANPCFGLDFVAVAETRKRIVEARDSGAAVLLVSEDLDEIFELSDRVLVMFEGRIAYDAPIAEARPDIVGHHMAGH
ncbi:MAG: ABC transporter ATP-binding protein [Alphaproteobacteria bacterium]|nr:ABC transporter ATP-binding protein [Alphaproteobacteria bacterium]MCW5742744.1 ABC transporter ATP-binding protein [Alphaproteobacteria bacterium]